MIRAFLFFLFLLCLCETRAQVYQYTETARPEEQIQQKYPYDIRLQNASGQEFKSDQVFSQNGKPTVLLFWLTTCVPCRHEMAAIAAKYESWRSELDFNLYAVSIDYPHNYAQFTKRVEESAWPFPAFLDLDREFGLIMPGKLNGLPQTFVLDKYGNIVQHKRKYTPGDEDRLFEFLKSM